MSIYTTLKISRKAALAKYRQLLESEEPSNEEIEEVLLAALGKKGYNFWILDLHDENDDEFLEGL